MLVMVLDETFHTTYEEGLSETITQNKKKHTHKLNITM